MFWALSSDKKFLPLKDFSQFKIKDYIPLQHNHFQQNSYVYLG